MVVPRNELESHDFPAAERIQKKSGEGSEAAKSGLDSSRLQKRSRRVLSRLLRSIGGENIRGCRLLDPRIYRSGFRTGEHGRKLNNLLLRYR